MFEKVNPSHPDKIADRIGGAIVDLGYKKQVNPKIAGECLIGHDECNIILETSVDYKENEIREIVERIAGKNIKLNFHHVAQDVHLAENQSHHIKCGDNGIFKGCLVNEEEMRLTEIVTKLYAENPTDGKFIYDAEKNTFIACQSNISTNLLKQKLDEYGFDNVIVNPLGDWTGGINVDSGATNRKLGSDMARAVTGGGLHFKDISKSDVSVNVYLHKLANEKKINEIMCKCAIGDSEIEIDGERLTYKHITDVAKEYIVDKIGGFEKLAEWGLVRIC